MSEWLEIEVTMKWPKYDHNTSKNYRKSEPKIYKSEQKLPAVKKKIKNSGWCLLVIFESRSVVSSFLLIVLRSFLIVTFDLFLVTWGGYFRTFFVGKLRSFFMVIADFWAQPIVLWSLPVIFRSLPDCFMIEFR